jgi:hypothetical protein
MAAGKSALLLFVVALAIAGCGSSSGSTIPSSKLSKLVLQRADLPKVFVAFSFNRQVSADQPVGQSDPARFGREDGWIGRYHRAGSPRTKGPLVVASRVDLFKDAGGAKQELEVERGNLARNGAKEIDAGGLGDQAFGVTTLQGGTISVRNFVIAWREANAVAKLELSGFAQGFTRADALALARTQDARLRNAIG